jgi:hypothetical protein
MVVAPEHVVKVGMVSPSNWYYQTPRQRLAVAASGSLNFSCYIRVLGKALKAID